MQRDGEGVHGILEKHRTPMNKVGGEGGVGHLRP